MKIIQVNIMENIPTIILIPLLILSSVVVPILVSYISNVTMLKKARQDVFSTFEKKFNENRWTLYLEFVLLIEEMIRFSGEEEFPHERFETRLSNIGTKMMLVSSDNVVKLYGDWRSINLVNGFFDITSMNLLFELINQLRIDLGNTASQLDLDRLLRVIVPNYSRAL